MFHRSLSLPDSYQARVVQRNHYYHSKNFRLKAFRLDQQWYPTRSRTYGVGFPNAVSGVKEHAV